MEETRAEEAAAHAKAEAEYATRTKTTSSMNAWTEGFNNGPRRNWDDHFEDPEEDEINKQAGETARTAALSVLGPFDVDETAENNEEYDWIPVIGKDQT